MAEIAIDVREITDVLPDRFFGGTYVSNGYSHPTSDSYLDAITQIPLEALRTSVQPDNATPASSFPADANADWSTIDTGWDRVLRVFRAFHGKHRTGWHPILFGFPDDLITDVDEVVDIAPIQVTSDGRSPRGQVAFVKLWQTMFGPDVVVAWEPYNEPAGEMHHWWTVPDDARKAADWAAVWQRWFFDAKQADPATSKVLLYGFSYSKGGECYDEQRREIKRFLTGEGIEGWPHYDQDNTHGQDGLSFHGYFTTSSTQSENLRSDMQSFLNGIVYDDDYDASADKAGLRVAAREWRRHLDELDSSQVMAMTEMYPGLLSNEHANDAQGALEDVLRAIVLVQDRAALKLEAAMLAHALNEQQFSPWIDCEDATVNPAKVQDGVTFYSNGKNYGLNVRGRVLADIIGPYLRTYKQQVRVNVTTGLTPPTDADNAVPRVHVLAGKSADGKRLGMLIANADLTSDEPTQIDWGASASASGLMLPAKQMCGDPLPPVTALPTVIGAGEVWLIEVPLPGLLAAFVELLRRNLILRLLLIVLGLLCLAAAVYGLGRWLG